MKWWIFHLKQFPGNIPGTSRVPLHDSKSNSLTDNILFLGTIKPKNHVGKNTTKYLAVFIRRWSSVIPGIWSMHEQRICSPKHSRPQMFSSASLRFHVIVHHFFFFPRPLHPLKLLQVLHLTICTTVECPSGWKQSYCSRHEAGTRHSRVFLQLCVAVGLRSSDLLLQSARPEQRSHGSAG